MSENVPRWNGPARPNVDESRWNTPAPQAPPPQGPPPSQPSGPNMGQYLAEIAANTKTIANWVTFLGIMWLLGVVIFIVVLMAGGAASRY